jgi:hypothetical protein
MSMANIAALNDDTSSSADDELRIEVVAVGPAEARRMLDRAGPNRNLTRDLVKEYADAMRRGDWRLTEPIIFSGGGHWPGDRLLDGQHRLDAVIHAGVTVPMIVLRGVNPDALGVLNTGKRRSLSDLLTIHGYANTRALAAAVNLHWEYENRKLYMRASGGAPRLYRASHITLLGWLGEHPGMVYSTTVGGAVRRKEKSLNLTAYSVMHYLLTDAPDISAEAAGYFLNGVANGAGLPPGHPILLFRRWSANTAGSRVAPIAAVHLAYLIKAWLYSEAGRNVVHLSFRPFVDPFPRLPTPVGEDDENEGDDGDAHVLRTPVAR